MKYNLLSILLDIRPPRLSRVVCLLFSFSVTALLGQSTNFVYHKVAEGDKEFGKKTQVEALIQDRRGFVWVGFLGGLARYDGYKAKFFVHDPKDTTSISANFIHNLFEDKEGNIWASTRNGGLDKVDGKTDQITRYSKGLQAVNKGYFTVMADGGEEELLLGGNLGFFRFDKGLGVFHQLDSLRAYRVIYPYQDSLFILLHEDGMKVYDPLAKSFSKIKDPVLSRSDSLMRTVNDMLIDQSGAYWFASIDYGVIRYEPNSQSFTHFCQDLEIGCDGGVFTNELAEDQLGNIWVAGKEGLRKYDKAMDTFITLTEKENSSISPLVNRVKRLLIDKDNNLWIGNKKGLFISSLEVHHFHSFFHIEDDPSSLPNKAIFSLHIDDQNDLWGATYGGGLMRMRIPAGEIITYKRGKEREVGKLFSDDLLAVTEASDKTLWVGTEIGLHRAKRVGDKALSFTFYPNPIIGETYVYNIAERPDHKLWVGTPGGLFVFDPSTETFSAYPEKESIQDAVLYIRQDGPILWLGTARNGLLRYDTETEVYSQFLADPTDSTAISNNRVNHIQQDPSGWYWVSTSIGLNLFDPITHQFQTFLEADGLPGNYMNAVLLDDQGDLWVSLLNGTSKLVIDRKGSQRPIIHSIRNYFEGDGMGASGYNFGAYAKGENGMIFLGGSGLMTFFLPEEISKDAAPSQVTLTGLEVLNEPWNGGQPVAGVQEIELDYYQNFFSIAYSSLDFLAAENVQFSYMLEGVDEGWVLTDRNYSGYTKVKPGTYNFKVKATNRKGEWGVPSQLQITIKSPFWLTWWFISFVCVLIFALGYLIFLLRSRQLYSQRAHKLAEQSAQHKAAFLANMSHEIRTPMNAVVGTTHLIQNTSLDPKQKRYVETIRQSAENLLVIINDILDFSKIEAGKLAFIQKPFNIRELMDYVYSTLAHRALENNTRLTLTCADEVPEVLVGDATRLIQILLNLGSNAVKFTKEGMVDIAINGRIDDKATCWLNISVRDTGIGIAEENLKTIFDSFVQGGIEVSQKFGGTGLGLTIARRLVIDQGGEIEVESELGKGTVFEITIPYGVGEVPQILSSSEEANISPNHMQNVTLLLVEDNAINREIAVEIIQEMIPQARIDTANNGQEALGRMTEVNRYDLVLMDIKMPIMDGYTCAKYIREHLPPPINRTPIIALTATATDEEIQKCLEVGMNDFLAKPFDPKALEQKILTFSQKNMTDENKY